MSTTRRDFLSSSSKLLAASGFASLTNSPLLANAENKKIPAADKIGIALIGCRNMGFGNLQNALKVPGVECVALCDVDDEILKTRSADVTKIQGKAPLHYKDYRKLLENKDINAVIIGTPDHWHCLPFIAACEAGKDIYVEKPLANTIAECDIMVGAARKYNRVVQVGQQQRSGVHWKQAMDFMNAGKIGQLRKVNIWANFNYGVGQPKVPDETPPAGVNFDMWLGPAPQRSFNKNRFHGSWRMFWDYGGGLMTDWGVHLIDMALWVKAISELPIAVVASGGNFAFPDRAHETFDTMSVSYQLKDYTINWEHTAGIQSGPYGRAYGLAFVGNDATLVIDRDGWELFPESENGKYKVAAMPKQSGRDSHEPHMKNFIECIKTRKDPACSIEKWKACCHIRPFSQYRFKNKFEVGMECHDKKFWKQPVCECIDYPCLQKTMGFTKSVVSFIYLRYSGVLSCPLCYSFVSFVSLLIVQSRGSRRTHRNSTKDTKKINAQL